MEVIMKNKKIVIDKEELIKMRYIDSNFKL